MLTYELRENDVAFIQLDDGKANARSPDVMGEMHKALDQAEAEAKSVVIAGREDRFSAGFDLKHLTAGPESAKKLLHCGIEICVRLYGFPKPLVVACTGHAIAGGAVMLLTGDYRIGAEGNFKICLNEVAIGLPLPVFAVELARARLDPRFLNEATTLAQIYAPAHALKVGYLDRVVDTDQVIEAALTKAVELGEFQSFAFHATKMRLRQASIDHIQSTAQADIDGLLPAE